MLRRLLCHLQGLISFMVIIIIRWMYVCKIFYRDKNAVTLYIKQCFKSKIINAANKHISECKLDKFQVHRICN